MVQIQQVLDAATFMNFIHGNDFNCFQYDDLNVETFR